MNRVKDRWEKKEEARKNSTQHQDSVGFIWIGLIVAVIVVILFG